MEKNQLLRALLLLCLSLPAFAGDFALQTVQVNERVWALVGPIGPRSYDNYGLNNNVGFVVTDAGVVLIDSGSSRSGAQLIEQAIARVTPQPVRWVINVGIQDHRWLGNDWFARRGAEVIALQRTVQGQRTFAAQQMAALQETLKERFAGTAPYHAPAPLAGDHELFTLGGVNFELHWLGDGHFAGDAALWLPQDRIVFTGDLVYVDRMLGVLPGTRTASWRDAFRALEKLGAEKVVPGHGSVCDMAKARRDTGDYLDFLTDEIGAAVAAWEPLDEVVQRLGDAPQFQHLEHYDGWHRTNISRTYVEFEQR
jgi:glyoxylase-like metal-dependent hydrolase (beta-lactamase superfamily II)